MMNQLQMLKMALISYVTNSAKAIWSAIAHPLTIKGKKNGNLIGYRMYGNSTQSGTPTPSAPKEISSVGTLTTKNLLDVESVWSEYANDEGGITFDKANIPANAVTVNCKENTQYTFSFEYQFVDNSDAFICAYFYYTDGYSSSIPTRGDEGAVSVKSIEGKTVSGISFGNGLGSYKSLKLTNMQIEEGTVATEYEPYQKYKIPVKVTGVGKEEIVNIYLDKPLCKVGNYKDEIDFEKGQVIRRVYHEKLTDITSKSSTSSTYYMYLTDLSKRPMVAEKVAYCLSNKFAAGDYSYSNIPRNKYVIKTYRTNAGVDRVAYSLTSSNITDAKAEIGDGFDVIYVLYTEIKESVDLTPLPQYNGTITYEVLTDTPPSGIEVCYYG